MDALSGAYASAHALPDASSAKLATYFAGEEIVALDQQGDWLQVRKEKRLGRSWLMYSLCTRKKRAALGVSPLSEFCVMWPRCAS